MRWITAKDFGDDLKCDGNEVAVGSCSGGGSFGQKDCPGETLQYNKISHSLRSSSHNKFLKLNNYIKKIQHSNNSFLPRWDDFQEKIFSYHLFMKNAGVL